MQNIWVLGMAVVATIAGAGPLGAATALPGAPTITSVTPGPRALSIAFKEPVIKPTGIFIYRADCTSSNGGQKGGIEGLSSPIYATGLTGGRTYVCRMRVVHGDGTFGPYSPKSADVVPKNEEKTHVPDPPTLLYAHAGKELVRVAFTRLDHSGGLKVTRYQARCVSSDGGHPNKQQSTHAPIIVDHLTAGKTYTCSVAARNALGFGAYGTASAPVKTTS